MATDRTPERLARVQDTARPGPADQAAWLRGPPSPVDYRRSGTRATDLAVDESVDTVRRPTDRSLRPTDADREQDLGRYRLLPHGCPVLGRGDEGQLRPATDVDGQQPLPSPGRPHRRKRTAVPAQGAGPRVAAGLCAASSIPEVCSGGVVGRAGLQRLGGRVARRRSRLAVCRAAF